MPTVVTFEDFVELCGCKKVNVIVVCYVHLMYRKPSSPVSICTIKSDPQLLEARQHPFLL